VTASSGSALALIIDDDLGFLMWLGEVFMELGCPAVPALHCRQALALTKRINLPVSTLLINPELRGAARFVERLLAINPDARVVLIRNSAADSSPLSVNAPKPSHARTKPSGIQAGSILERPSPLEPISRTEWLARVRQALGWRNDPPSPCGPSTVLVPRPPS
jgi:hypothetical protein